MAHIWNKFRFQGSWTMIGSIPSRRETLHIVRIGVRRALSFAAIYVIALHTILLGLVPVSAGESVVGDPLSVICHSNAQAAAPAEQVPGRPDIIPGHACDQCNLCSASVAPVLDPVLAGQLAPMRQLQVLIPLVEASLQTPVSNSFSSGTVTTGPSARA